MTADEVEVVLANNDRVTLRVGDVFLKVDADLGRTDAEVAAMELAPVPTAKVLWRRPPVLALARLPGAPLARLGEPSVASPAAWSSAGATIRALHEAPLPPRPGPSLDELSARLGDACTWLVDTGALSVDDVARNRRLAEAVLRPWPQVFVHGDLHIAHVFVEDDEVTGLLDWSEAAQGDALFDLATVTLGHPEHLVDVLAGYGADVDVDRDLVRGWWSYRCLVAIRWLVENGYGAPETLEEVALLRRSADG